MKTHIQDWWGDGAGQGASSVRVEMRSLGEGSSDFLEENEQRWSDLESQDLSHYTISSIVHMVVKVGVNTITLTRFKIQIQPAHSFHTWSALHSLHHYTFPEDQKSSSFTDLRVY